MANRLALDGTQIMSMAIANSDQTVEEIGPKTQKLSVPVINELDGYKLQGRNISLYPY